MSTTFYPLETYCEGLRPLVAATPLYQGVELMRGLILGEVGSHLLTPVLYLTTMGGLGLALASRRLSHLLLR